MNSLRQGFFVYHMPVADVGHRKIIAPYTPFINASSLWRETKHEMIGSRII